jgi:hypothetical protein
LHTIGSWWRASSRGPSPLTRHLTQAGRATRVATFLLCLTIAVPAAARARPLAASDVVLDLTPASALLATWPKAGTGTSDAPRRVNASERRAAVALGHTPAYRALRAFIAAENRCMMEDGDFARVVTHPDSTFCGLSLQPAYVDRDQIRALAADLRAHSDSLAMWIASEAGRYLPSNEEWQPIRFWFVVSSRWSFDAVTLSPAMAGTAEPIVLINLTEVIGYGANSTERVRTLAHVMAHEAFHSALGQRERLLAGWAKYQHPIRSPLDYIARVMTDEGVAHWIDWGGRPDADSLFTMNVPGPREVKAFEALAIACRRVRDRDADFASRTELLQMASNGPLWSKYGAISGMFAAYRIESRLGLDSLRTAVTGGPAEFLRMYGRVAAADTLLKRVPAALGGGG